MNKLAWIENITPAVDSSPALKKLLERSVRRTIKHQINDGSSSYRDGTETESEVIDNVPSSNRQMGLNKEISNRGNNLSISPSRSETYPGVSERGLSGTSGDTKGTERSPVERKVLDFIRIRDIQS